MRTQTEYNKVVNYNEETKEKIQQLKNEVSKLESLIYPFKNNY